MGDSFGSQIPNIGGQRRTWNQVTVDGLNGNELSGTNRMNSSINLDAIAEVKVLLNTYKAEFGHSAGANIEIVSKSGSQTYHGSGYWYGRRDAWNATRGRTSAPGIAKPKQKIDTPGFNLGGPVKIPGLFDQSGDKKLFFFYSMEAPQVQKPGQVRLYRMPTALERHRRFLADLRRQRPADVHQGSAVERRVQRDDRRRRLLPRQHHPGEPARSERAGAAEHDAAARTSPSTGAGSGALSNFTRQETPENPRMNNLLRIDGRPSGNNSYWAVVPPVQLEPVRIGDHRRPGEVGLLRRQLRVGRQRHQRRLEPRLVVEQGERVRRRHPPRDRRVRRQGRQRLMRSSRAATSASRSAQFHPELNPQGYLPFVRFGLNTTGIDTPDFTYDNRLGSTAYDWLDERPRQLHVDAQHAHRSRSAGTSSTCRTTRRAAATWAGDITFSNNTSNPLNTNFAFANAIARRVLAVHRDRQVPRDAEPAVVVGVVPAGHLAGQRRASRVDYGARFL